jgi:hypothetical protein
MRLPFYGAKSWKLNRIYFSPAAKALTAIGSPDVPAVIRLL